MCDSTSSADPSVHGRDRRAQRQIGKKDLQAAVLHGRKEKAMMKTGSGWVWTGRWKYTFANIVYITDWSSRYEVTSWVQPLVIDAAPVSAADQRRHEEAAMQRRRDPASCTSHMVFVVDQSGSMRTCDVEDFKTRSDAVFGSVALDILGQQIDQSSSSLTDVVSLIEMRQDATTVFEREPMTNVLFNKMLKRKKDVRPCFHGNYIPALEEAARLLSQDQGGGTCALLLVFLSDGRPSDPGIPGMGEGRSAQIDAKVEELARRFGSQLTVGTIGFGGGEGDFQVLKGMAAAATAAGAHGSFSYAARSSSTLSSLVSSLGARLSATRSRIAGMTSVAGSHRGKTLRPAPAPTPRSSSGAIDSAEWRLFTGSTERTHFEWKGKGGGWTQVPFYTAGVPGVDGLSIAIRWSELGRGAERVVYELRQFTQLPGGPVVPVGDKLVAKESLFVEDDALRRDFHVVFCKTQQQAGYFARRFNQRIAHVFAQRRWLVPATLSFLPCSVYVLDGRGFLVEKMLDRSKWYKWNTNAGSVMGSAEAGPGQQQEGNEDDVDDEAGAVPFHMPAIAEGSDSEGEDSGEEEPYAAAPARPQAAVAQDLILASDFPQAFSHFTYRDSHRQRLVCDLQGTLDTSVSPARYELTDPAIHYKSGSGRSRVYGRTDHGHKGISRFFQTHQCNALCKLLGLPSDR